MWRDQPVVIAKICKERIFVYIDTLSAFFSMTFKKYMEVVSFVNLVKETSEIRLVSATKEI